jgi:hypothetical protein
MPGNQGTSIEYLSKFGDIVINNNLSGTLSAGSILYGDLKAGGTLHGVLSMFKGDYEPYTGPYDISPNFEGITIATANRYLSNNITILPIQVDSVSNTSGGRTVFIGGII